MFLVIDNYDSFTYNLVQYLGELASNHSIVSEVRVERNDSLTIDEIKDLSPDAILLSPGPGDPNQSGVCLDILSEISTTVPTLGVCLGHQAITQAFGGKIIRAKELMHGKTSNVFHQNNGLFKDLPNPLVATRYRGLGAEGDRFPGCLEEVALLEDNTIMGIKHRLYPHINGVQFHPESVLTESGHKLLSNFLDIAESS